MQGFQQNRVTTHIVIALASMSRVALTSLKLIIIPKTQKKKKNYTKLNCYGELSDWCEMIGTHESPSETRTKIDMMDFTSSLTCSFPTRALPYPLRPSFLWLCCPPFCPVSTSLQAASLNDHIYLRRWIQDRHWTGNFTGAKTKKNRELRRPEQFRSNYFATNCNAARCPAPRMMQEEE